MEDRDRGGTLDQREEHSRPGTNQPGKGPSFTPREEVSSSPPANPVLDRLHPLAVGYARGTAALCSGFRI